MIGKKGRHRSAGLALMAAMALLLVVGGTALANVDGNDTGGATVCVEGVVINHREMPVDGTRTTPAMIVEAAQGTTGIITEIDADGRFVFEDLPEGMWDLRLILPPDWEGMVPQAPRSGVAETGITMFAAQEDCYQVVFKIRRFFDLIVWKWEERLDGSVFGGLDWEITVTPVGDPFVKAQTGTTGQRTSRARRSGAGEVIFPITPGEWIVSEAIQEGWEPITPHPIRVTLDQYMPAMEMLPVVFKNRQPPCTGKIVVKKSGFGTAWVEGEGGPVERLEWLGPLAGWEIVVSRLDGKMPPSTKHTDAAGEVVFDGLAPGVYRVEEVAQAGWKPISENPQIVILGLDDHGQCQTRNVLFENEEVRGELSIHGQKTYRAWDGPADGLGLSGWVITATLVGTDLYTTTTTDALGGYVFDQAALEAAGLAIPYATIEVCQESRENWIHYTPKCVTVMFPYPVPSDYTGEEVNFVDLQDPPLPGMAAAASSCTVSHRVAAGENLSRIAQRYGTAVSVITRASGLVDPNYIRAGATLCVR